MSAQEAPSTTGVPSASGAVSSGSSAVKKRSASSERRHGPRRDPRSSHALPKGKQPKMLGQYVLQQTLGSGSFGKVKCTSMC